jgi:hypothetical protein
MEKDPETVDELKERVCSSGKMKFCTRVFHCLKFIDSKKNDLDLIQKVGCSWCSDKTQFIANSTILGAFLNIKSNTINTNFRDHGFQIVSNTDIRKEFSTLQVRQWKKRFSPAANFNAFMKPEDADKIPMIGSSSSTNPPAVSQKLNQTAPELNPISNPFQNHHLTESTSRELTKPFLIDIADTWPEETKMLLSGIEYRQQQVSIFRALLSFPLSQKEQNTLLSTATNHWKKLFGGVPTCSMLEGLQKLIPASSRNKETAYQMRINFLHLLNNDIALSQHDHESVSSRTLTFDNLFCFFIRYGHPGEFQSSLEYITRVEKSFNDEEDGQIEDYEDQPSFKHGFNPFLRKNEVKSAFYQSKMEHPWVIIQSKQPNRFALYTILSSSRQIVVVYINYNACEDKEKRFSVKFAENDTKFAANWDNLLELLYLKPENALQLDYQESIFPAVDAQCLRPKEQTSFSTGEVQIDFELETHNAGSLFTPSQNNDDFFFDCMNYHYYEKMSQS